MRRFLFSFWMAVTTTAAVAMAVSSCSSSSSAERSYAEPDASRRDASIVQPADGGAADAAPPPGPEPECATYCDSVLDSCKGSHAQYASRDECLAFCARFPLGKAGESDGNSLACRQFYAGSPARTDSSGYCGAAGPFGGGICGDRCPIFCELTLGACSPEAGAAPYASYPDCQTACLGFAYKSGAADGGGEPTSGPASGNTLNCRLFHVREVIMAGNGCENLGVASAACK